MRFEDRGETMFFGGGGDISIDIFGHDMEIAEALAYEIEAKVKDIRGVASTLLSRGCPSSSASHT